MAVARLVALLIVGLGAAGCMTVHDVLVGPDWALIDAAGAPPVADAGVHFEDDGTFTARTGCNSLSGTFHLEGNRILVDSELSSLSPCDPATGPLESLVLGVLHAGPTFAIDTGTGHLRLTGEAGEVLLFEAR